MEFLEDSLTLHTVTKGLYEITDEITKRIEGWGIEKGMCFLFNPHVSASFVLSEGFAGAAQKDIEGFYQRLVQDGADWYQHTAEGPDDAASHIRMTLTQQSVSIPINEGKLNLGMWQEIFFFEHRYGKGTRTVLIRCLKVA